MLSSVPPANTQVRAALLLRKFGEKQADKPMTVDSLPEFMRIVRMNLEAYKFSAEFSTALLYCNLFMHEVIDRKDACQFLEGVNTALVGAWNSDKAADDINFAFRFPVLRKELISILGRYGYHPDWLQYRRSWVDFLTCLLHNIEHAHITYPEDVLTNTQRATERKILLRSAEFSHQKIGSFPVFIPFSFSVRFDATSSSPRSIVTGSQWYLRMLKVDGIGETGLQTSDPLIDLGGGFGIMEKNDVFKQEPSQ